ncbi:hypothetical protein [Plantactinospora endophytica]|uniref:Uncharacterized protein n=1 Tax=Plantactinospora endophytica TaxID=673535 RepID=A0ABQ4DTM9_9ACTN|nr:hypothetical protein [Plantactinospora endophytica]GIG85809.1 hypothetical protein Pen02_07450 [Plantactinospora endophytica]
MTDDASTPAADDATSGTRYGSGSTGRTGPTDSTGRTGTTGSTGRTGTTGGADPAGSAGRDGAVPPGSSAASDRAAEQPRQPDPAARRRRRLTIAGIAGAAVVVLLVCGCLGAFAAGIGRFARESDRERTAQARADSACHELEQRLNRLTPPGATASPGERAAAIRDENAAVRPFLSEIERLRGWWDDDRDDDRDSDDHPRGRGESWQRLVDARTSYADALDRQVTNGEPAFFIAPRDPVGRPLLDRLQRGPAECGAAARRLAAPDL